MWWGLFLQACTGGGDGVPADDSDVPAVEDTAAERTPEPSAPPVTPRRLTVRQLRRALDELAGADVSGEIDFPTDARRHVFDNEAATSTVSQLLVDKLDDAAARVGAAWLDAARGSVVVRSEVEGWADAACSLTGVDGETWSVWWRDQPLRGSFTVDVDGTYSVDVRAFHRISQLFGYLPVYEVVVDGVVAGSVDLTGAYAPVQHALGVALAAGPHALELRLPYGIPMDTELTYERVHGPCVEANAVAFDWVQIRGPIDPARMRCVEDLDHRDDQSADTCTRTVLRDVARRAWRSEPSVAALSRLQAVVDAAEAEGGTWFEGIGLAVRAIVLSPRFLLVVEPTTTAPRTLSSWELAHRLASTLWGGLPDEVLVECATTGALRPNGGGTCGLTAQIDRMMRDPRFDAFIEDFAGQWLNLERLDQLTIDVGATGLDPVTLAEDMRGESIEVVRAFLTDDALAAAEIVRAPFTFLSGPLAAWYGVPGVSGPALQRVASPPDRPGVIGHGSVLTATSEPTRTSPVRRGAFVLDRVLCDPPGTPPPGIPPLQVQAGDTPADLVAALAQHRTEPSCAACHDKIDPLGLSLERFGPGGQFRSETRYDAHAPDGTPVPDLAALAAWFDAEEVQACVVAHTASFVTAAYVPTRDERVAWWTAHAASPAWADALRAVLTSTSFTTVRGGP